jgi:hypothetical protein
MKYWLLIVLLIGWEANAQLPTVIKIGGTATIEAKPDVATLSFQINAEGSTGKEANELSENKVLAIQKILTIAGLPDTLLKVSNVNLRFSKSYNSNREDMYQASFTAAIKVAANSKNLSALIEKIQSTIEVNLALSFGFSDDLNKKLKDNLLKMAIENAKEKAQLIASSIDKKIVGVVTVSYNFSDQIAPRVSALASESMLSRSEGIDFNIQEMALSESIQIEFYVQ